MRNATQQAVMCRRCRRVAFVPLMGDRETIVMCRCGGPALPINEIMMSLLAEGGE
jgi:hypothetical protein